MDERDVARERDAERRAEIDRIGIRVKAERTARSWSLRRLATESGLSASLLSAVENGRIVPTVGSLFAISDALEVSAPSLFPPSRQDRPTAEARDDADPLPEPPMGSYGSSSAADSDQFSLADESRSISDSAAVEPDRESPSMGRTVGGLPVSGQVPTRPGRARRPRPFRRASSAVAPVRPNPIAAPAVAGAAPREADRSFNSLDSGERSGRVSGDAAAGPPGTVDPRPMPGVQVLVPDARRRMPLPDGSVWTLLHREPGDAVVILEGTLRPDSTVPATFSVRLGSTSVIVQRGPLRFESGFRHVDLRDGAEVVVDAGVPFRISAAPTSGTDSIEAASVEPTIVVAILEGGWDGRLL